MKSVKINLFALFSLTLIIGFSCQKKDMPTTTETVAKGKLWMHFHTTIGENDVNEYNVEYLDESGRGVKLSKAQFYISDIELVKLNNDVVQVKDFIIKTLEDESYFVGDVEVGNFKAIRFKFGLNGDLNNLTPENGLSDTSMWFNQNDYTDGYLFMNTRGEVDTSSDFSGKYSNFNYKLGLATNVVEISLPENYFPVYDGIISYVHLNADYAKLFNGIDLKDLYNLSVNSKTENQTKLDLMTQLKLNIANSFISFE